MNAHPVDAGASNARPRSRIGVVRFLSLLAICAVVAWAAIRVWRTATTSDSARRFHEALGQLQSASSSASDRAMAAANLRFASSPPDVETALDALARALDDGDLEVRTVAAQSLGALVDGRRNARDGAAPAELLKKWSELAARALVKATADPVAAVRASAVTALGLTARSIGAYEDGRMSGPATDGAGEKDAPRPAWRPPPELEAALEDGTAHWSRAVAKEYYGFAEVLPPRELVAGLKDEAAEVRIAAIMALLAFPINLDPALPILFEELKNEERGSKPRELCTRLVRAAWPTSASVPCLVEALKAKQNDIRAVAALLLGRIGPDASAAVPGLLALLKEPVDESLDRSSFVDYQQDPPCAAARALGAISANKEVVSALARLVESDVEQRRAAAAHGLAQIGKPAAAAAPELVAANSRWLDSKKQYGGYELTIALGRVAPGTAVAADAARVLVRTLDSKNEAIVRHAARSLGHLGKAAALAVPRLRELKEKSQSAPVRAAVEAAIDAIETASKEER